MKRIYVTLAERVDRPGDSPGDVGELVALDWDSKTVLQRIPVSSGREVKVGRSRGATGIAWHEGKIYVSCRQGIVSLDPNNYRVGRVHPIDKLGIPGGIHQIKEHNGELFIVCTAGDSLAVMQRKRIIRLETLASGQDQLHFNSIAWDPKGHEYHLYMADKRSPGRRKRVQSRIVNHTTGQDVRNGLGRLPHDLLFLDESRLLYCASADGDLHLLDTKTRQDKVVFHRGVTGDPGGTYRLQGFMRGLAYAPGDDSVFVGLAPGTICELDATDWSLKGEVVFERGSKCAIYDFLLDPRDWGHPCTEVWVPSGEGISDIHHLSATLTAIPRVEKQSWWRRLWKRIRRS